MERFKQNPAGFTAAASDDFMAGFCAVLRGFAARQKIRHGSSLGGSSDEWVDANLVYQEYIRDRHHVHLSATRWKSVAGFLRFLGQKGLAEIRKEKQKMTESADTDYLYILPETDQEEREEKEEEKKEESSSSEEEPVDYDPRKRPKWFIKLIDKSPEAIMAAKADSSSKRKQNEEQSLQARQLEAVERQAKTATGLKSIVLVEKKTAKNNNNNQPQKILDLFNEEEEEEERSVLPSEQKKRLAVLDELAAQDAKIKRATIIPYHTEGIEIDCQEESSEEIPWIRKGLLVRIKNDQLASGKYYKLLAVIDAVIDDFGAQVSVLKSGDQLLLDQDDCEPASKVADEEYDAQLSALDAKIMSNALKSDRCIIIATGKEGRIVESAGEKFVVEIIEAGTSHIHRPRLTLESGQFCIFWE